LFGRETFAHQGAKLSAVVIQGGLHHLQNLDEIAACLSSVEMSYGWRSGFISEPSDTLCFVSGCSSSQKRPLEGAAYTRNWHALHMEEKTTHERYLKNIVKSAAIFAKIGRASPFESLVTTFFYCVRNKGYA